MADSIDVDKLKNDAFEAIDALFSEGDEDTSFGEQSLEETGQAPDEFARLAEYTLALDWEYSEKELNRLSRHLDKITLKNPANYNQSLVKMIKSIINYLQKAKDKAFPQTLNVMASIIDALKDVNTKDFDEAGIKLQLNSTYDKFVSLKEEISKYNKKFRKYTTEKKQVKTVNVSDFTESMESKRIDTNVLTRLDHLEEKVASLEKQNSALKRLIIDQHQGGVTTAVSNFDSSSREDTGDEFDADSFSVNEKLSLPVEEPVTVDVDDISFDSSPLQTTKEEIVTPEIEGQEDVKAQPDN
jgi:hypothetical protein